jgi:hypothetical protein
VARALCGVERKEAGREAIDLFVLFAVCAARRGAGAARKDKELAQSQFRSPKLHSLACKASLALPRSTSPH